MEQPALQQDSPAWITFTCISFAVALGLMVAGIYLLPVDLWIKGYLTMGLFFTVGSTITLSKTLRDEHEARKFVNRVHDARTEKMLTELELKR